MNARSTRGTEEPHERVSGLLKLESIEPWAPHPTAAPHVERAGDSLVVAANGTATCAGGWQLGYSLPDTDQEYDVRVLVEHSGLERPEDALHVAAFWGAIPADQAGRSPLCPWDYLLSEAVGDGVMAFHRRLSPPEGARRLTIRYTLRWTATGRSVWKLPEVARVSRPRLVGRRVSIGVVTGRAECTRPRVASVADSAAYFAGLCERAAASAQLDLIVLPECALQARTHGNPLDLAVPVDATEVASFRRIAQRNRVRIILGLWERNRDAVHNSAVLIGPSGDIDGIYRKVHLAVAGENECGVLPGQEFPVFETEIGRIGCNICVDNSTLEAARLVALGGAEILVIPIAGDNRADRWSLGPSIFNESRWRAIMRTRALDNQVIVVAARNDGIGSCIVDCAGDVIAWNEGDRDFVHASVALDSPARCWNGAPFRDMQWMQRRSHLYGALLGPSRSGSWTREFDDVRRGPAEGL